MKVDILVFAAHPDDAELACSGTVMSQIALGKKVAIVDLTRGEMSTRGTLEIRAKETEEASKILGIHARENLGLADVFFENNAESRIALIRAIRHYRPEIVLANAIRDRHPDHPRGGELAADACFWAGLAKIETERDGQAQKPWRPKQLFHYIQSWYIQPDFVVDISAFWERKVAAIKAFKSQFFDPSSKEPLTFISTPAFLQFIEARAREFGQSIEVDYAEGFTKTRMLGITDLSALK